MKFIIDVAKGEEDFLLKLLESLDIVTSIEKIDIKKNVINEEHAKVLKKRIDKYKSGELQTRSWEEIQRDLNSKYGL